MVLTLIFDKDDKHSTSRPGFNNNNNNSYRDFGGS